MSNLESAKEAGKARITQEYENHIMLASITINQDVIVVGGGMSTWGAFAIAERAAIYEGRESVNIRDINNTIWTLNLSDFKLLIDKLAVYGNSAWEKKVMLQTQIDAATTIDEIIAIVW